MRIELIDKNCYMVTLSFPPFVTTSMVYVCQDGDAVMVDGGCEDRTELLDYFTERGIRIKAAVCTHLHWDHVANIKHVLPGGGRVLAFRGEDTPYASRSDEDLSKVEFVDEGKLELFGKEFELIPLPGHTPGQAAVVTPNGICHVGDAILTKEVLLQAKLPFMTDTSQAIASMEKLRGTSFERYMAAHCGMISEEELPGIIDANIQKEIDIYKAMLAMVKAPVDIDEFVGIFLESLGISFSKTVRAQWLVTIKQRVKELVLAEELTMDGNYIMPAYKGSKTN